MLVHQSSTRRKSCSGCVKAKRRCDLRLPSCSRCQKRRLDCSFARVWEERIAEEVSRVEAPVMQRREGKEVARTSTPNRTSPLLSHGSPNTAVAPDDFNFELNTTAMTPGDFDFSNYNFDDLQNLDQYMSNSNEISTIDQSLSIQPNLGIGIRNIDFSVFPNTNIPSPNWRNPIGIPPPTPTYSLHYPTIVTLAPNQLNYQIQHFKSCITSLLNTGHAPFIHSIFNNQNCPLATPQSTSIFQNLLIICSLQSNKTPHNTTDINSIMNAKISSLIASSPKDLPFLDLLASVQALTVYQIIRLFDTDPDQHILAERQAPHLYSWATKLQTYTAPYQHHINIPLSPWQEWIQSESVRRTVLTSMLLKSCYKALKYGTSDDVPILARLPVSNKGSFWRLGEEEWKERLEIEGEEATPKLLAYKKFVEEWTVGNVRDVDEFGTALLVCCVGVREMGIRSQVDGNLGMGVFALPLEGGTRY